MGGGGAPKKAFFYYSRNLHAVVPWKTPMPGDFLKKRINSLFPNMKERPQQCPSRKKS